MFSTLNALDMANQVLWTDWLYGCISFFVIGVGGALIGTLLLPHPLENLHLSFLSRYLCILVSCYYYPLLTPLTTLRISPQIGRFRRFTYLLRGYFFKDFHGGVRSSDPSFLAKLSKFLNCIPILWNHDVFKRKTTKQISLTHKTRASKEPSTIEWLAEYKICVLRSYNSHTGQLWRGLQSSTCMFDD